MDIYSEVKRSAIMAAVRSHGNVSTEARLIKLFRTARITGWRRRQTLPGSPDFVFSKARIAVFVDGCFWHCCPIHASFPVTRQSVWASKLRANRLRDRAADSALRARGWKVLRIWEHDLTRKNAGRTIRRVKRALRIMLPRQIDG